MEEERKPKKPKKPKKPRRPIPWGRWLKRVAIFALVAGALGGGYWYVYVKNAGKPPPWAGLFDKAKKLVSRVTQPPARRPAPPPPAPSRRTTAPPAATPPPAEVRLPAPAPTPVAQPMPPPVASPFSRFDRLGDSLSRIVRTFNERATLFDGGQMDCNGLASGLVAVENMWLTYNAERTARLPSLDQGRVVRGQTLFASVDAVSRRFENSGCPRP